MSLTDLLKRTLYFFEESSARELAPFIRRKMLQNYTLSEVEEKVNLCLTQHACFQQTGEGFWRLDLCGARENDHFYHLLLKKGEPLSLWEVLKSSRIKKKKLRRLIAEEASLMNDGRFVQLSNGTWGLTEWGVDAGHYPLKHLIIKTLRLHPAGLSLSQIVSAVTKWRPTTEDAVKALLQKFPYFEQGPDGIWHYNRTAHKTHDDVLIKYLGILREQKKKWRWEREQWSKKYRQVQVQVAELKAAEREVATAACRQTALVEENERLNMRLAEKGLLLSLRKKEVVYYQEQVRRLEAKANSILHQCRLWVQRARDAQQDNAQLRQALSLAQDRLEEMYRKLTQYRERDRDHKTLLAELKEQHAAKVAELHAEVVDLKEKLEKYRDSARRKELFLNEEIDRLQAELREALDTNEDLQQSVRFLEQELMRTRGEYRRLERKLKHPLVRMAARISVLLARSIM